MSARRIARELAVIVLPQLPKDARKLEKADLNALTHKAVGMLCDYAKQSLADADALFVKAAETLTKIEIEHPDNSQNVLEMAPVPLTTSQLKSLLDLIERSMQLVSEALDMPKMIVQCQHASVAVSCKKCRTTSEVRLDSQSPSEAKEFLFRLVSAYLEHRDQIDEFIAQAKAKWKVERMVTIDRDILRLACAEAFYLADVPVNVSINEAVELSHRFADQKAARFINGILADLVPYAVHFRKTGSLADRPVGEPESQDSTIKTP